MTTPNRWHSLDRNDLPVGLKNYRLINPHPNAAAAIDRLYERGWFQGVRTMCGCGAFFETWSAAKCKSCREQCGHLAVSGYIIKTDGRAAPCQYCGWCGHKLDDPPRFSTIYNILFKDSRERIAPEPCERCGATTGTQLHHWAPSAIFDDADEWPTAWLCPECHEFWHQTMRETRAHKYPDGHRVAIPKQRTPDIKAQR